MNWPVVSLGDVAEIQGGIQKQPKRSPQRNAFPFLRVANVTAQGLNLEEIHAIELFDGELERYRLHRGDLLVVEGNGSASQIGRAAVWDGSIKDAVHQNHLIRVRPGCLLNERFLGLVWNSPSNRAELARIASSTSGLHTLSVGKLKKITLPLPPMDEQRRIVDILEDHLSRLDAAADGLLKARKRIDSFVRSALDQHFAKGTLVPLTDLIEGILAGKSFGTSNSPAGEGDWGIIKVSAMTWGRFNPDENKAVSGDRVDPRFEIREGDLLVSRANTADYVGASVLVGPVRPKLLLSDKSLRLTPKAGVNPEWLWRALQAPSARRQITAKATGTKDSMRNISQAALHQVLLPKVGEAMQSEALNAFAAVATSTNRLRTEIDGSMVRHGNLGRALLAAAFSGRLSSVAPDVSEVREKVDA